MKISKTEKIVMGLIVAVMALVIVMICSGCERNNSADSAIAEQTAAAMKEANSQVGLPAITNWQEKRLAKMIYELRDQEGVSCYAYTKALNGKLVYLGRCVGYGLPYCVQYSNPERVYHSGGHWGGTMPQPEPNGLFMPETLSATWLMMVDPRTNQPRPVYVEPEIVVSPFVIATAIGNP